jgi:site-specific DNA recombinase
MTRRSKRNSAGNRFVIYLRCSTDDQRQGDFTTIDAQRELNRQHVGALGGTIVKEYADEGKSGTTLDRPGWKQLLADAEAGLFDQVCVTYMSRLGRGNAYVIAEYELRKHSVSVEMVKEKFSDDLAGYMGKTMTTMMDGVYPKMVSQWTRTKMQAMVDRGYHCGGLTPFGYRTVVVTDANGFHSADKQPPKRLVPDDATASLVESAFSMYVDGASLAEIRRYLNTASNRTWTTTTVRNLLANETYTGVQQFGDWRNEDAHVAVVANETFEQVRTRLPQYTTRQRPQAVDDYGYFLKGVVHCPYCGCPYTQASAHGRTGRVHYYVCQGANHKRTPCPVVRVNADRLHYAVLSTINRAANHRTYAHKLIADSETWSRPSEQAVEVRGQLAKRKQFLDMQLGNLTNALAEGRAVGPLLTAIEKLEKDRASVIAELGSAEELIAASTIQRPTADHIQASWGRFIRMWPELNDHARQQVLGGLVTRVNVKQRERVTLELQATPQSHAQWFELTCNLGAGVGLEPTTFGL